MAITVKHSKVSTIPDDADTSLVRPSDWNADHTLVGVGTSASLDAGVANGGTGASTAADGLNALLPSQTGNNGKVLSTDGTNATWSTNGSGDVVGPASSTDNAVARFDTTTGKLLQNSVVTIGDTGATTGVTTFSASTSVTTPIVQASNSGGLALKNSGGTTQMSVGAGGGDNMSINVSTNLNGTNAQIDISPTGTGHVHIKPSGSGAVEIAPISAGTMNNMVIGGTTPLAITGTTITATTFSGSGASLTSIPNSALVNSAITINGTSTSLGGSISVGTVTSVTGTSPVVSSGGATPAISMPAATTSVNGYLTSADWTTFNNKGSGSVTSVAQSFTGGIISVGGSPITTSGTLALTVAGTSGGIPYFSSATTWATSAALAANALMVGGGAGVAPSTVTTGTGVVTALGVNTGSAGAFVINGGALGTPSSGTVTNLTGTASININGTVGATTATTGAFTTVSATGVITSTLATGTAPFTVASTTQVANLNAATAGSATTATTATNIAGGALGSVPYQNAAGTTLFLAGTTSTTPSFVTSTGTGTLTQAPTLTSSTGTGNVVLATSPTLVTPALGTPSALVGTNITGTATAFNINGTVGATTANTGAFTTLSASSTVSGTGFTDYFASPPAIGGTTAAAITGTTITATKFVGVSGGTF